jgi:hypothetical protein
MRDEPILVRGLRRPASLTATGGGHGRTPSALV